MRILLNAAITIVIAIIVVWLQQNFFMIENDGQHAFKLLQQELPDAKLALTKDTVNKYNGNLQYHECTDDNDYDSAHYAITTNTILKRTKQTKQKHMT